MKIKKQELVLSEEKIISLLEQIEEWHPVLTHRCLEFFEEESTYLGRLETCDLYLTREKIFRRKSYHLEVLLPPTNASYSLADACYRFHRDSPASVSITSSNRYAPFYQKAEIAWKEKEEESARKEKERRANEIGELAKKLGIK